MLIDQNLNQKLVHNMILNAVIQDGHCTTCIDYDSSSCVVV